MKVPAKLPIASNPPREPGPALLPKLTNDQLPARAYFALAHAAQIAGCAPDDLLHFGGVGKIRLCVSLPNDVQVFSVLPPTKLRRGLTEEDQRNGGTDRSREPQKVEMVYISPDDCRSLELRGECVQSYFVAAWRFNPFYMPIPVKPTPIKLPTRGLDMPTPRRFVLLGPEGVRQETISACRVYVTADDLHAFRTGNGPSEPMEDLAQEDDRPWETELLRALVKASKFFFKNARRDDRGTYKSKADVQKWLEANGFSRTLAEHADTIIRPDFAKKAGRPREK